MVHKVVTIGEMMGRLSPPGNLRFEQANSFQIDYGGGEFNVSASLSNYGIPTDFITAIPNNPLGNAALKVIRSFGIGDEHILRQGDRLGLYFLEHGAAGRNSNVIYDRANSSMSQIQPRTINWEIVFKDATWFHWSGITPALSQSAADVCKEAVEIASKMGLTISTDLNYRSKLWKYGKAPKQVMPDLLKYSHVILADVDTTLFMLGHQKIDPNYLDENEVKKVFQKVKNLLPNLTSIGMTYRHSVNASFQKIGGILYTDEQLYRTTIKDADPVIDRVGTGDAFMAGLLYGLLEHADDPQTAIDFATGACVLKHTIYGDINRVTKEEVFQFIHSDGSAKVSR